MTFVPIPDWKGWKEIAKQDRLEGAVILIPTKRSWRCGHIFDAFPVQEEAVIAVVHVVLVDETGEEPDIGILWFGNGHGGKLRYGFAGVIGLELFCIYWELEDSPS
jgi:hypothetical protein